MSEGAIKQNLLRNKRKLKKILERKEKKMLDNPEFDYHGILYPSLKKMMRKTKDK